MTRDAVFGGLMGLVLAVIGFNFLTWQFWLVFVVALLWRYTTPMEE